jgi:hypothetical protein
MAQTSAGMAFTEATASLGTASPYLDWSSWGVSIAQSGGTRAVGSQHTRDGDVPIQKAGKRAGVTVTVRFVYTQEDAGLFEIARAIYETAGAACWFQWEPDGSNDSYAVDGIMTDFMYPQGEVSDGEVLLGEFTITAPEVQTF